MLKVSKSSGVILIGGRVQGLALVPPSVIRAHKRRGEFDDPMDDGIIAATYIERLKML